MRLRRSARCGRRSIKVGEAFLSMAGQGMHRLLARVVRLARHRSACSVAVTLFVLVVRAALLPQIPVPRASIHDEFSYLLAGETYALGRVANPSPPMWEFFETNHVIVQPVYASKYPPMQGLALAVGNLLGHPWIGVWLSTGLLCGALCWMLQGWLPPGLALLGAVIAALRVGIQGYWMNSYWGGSVPALGGALVLGALPRLRTRPRGAVWLVFTAGVVILANSRPYEGLVVVILATGVLVWWWRAAWGGLLRSALVPCLAPAVVALGLMLAFNRSITGNPFEMPYALYQQQYAVGSPLPFQAPKPAPVYRHEIQRKFWTEWDKGYSDRAREEPVMSRIPYLYLASLFFLGNIGALVFFLPVLGMRSPRIRLALGLLGSFGTLVVIERVVMPHYFAPAVGLIFLVLTAGLAMVWRIRWVGPVVVGVAMLIWVGQGISSAWRPDKEWYQIPRFAAARTEVIGKLTGGGGKHLVIVRYAPDHTVHEDWVVNGADFAATPVLFAHDMGTEANRRLVEAYPGRTVWLLEPDAGPVRLVPYALRETAGQ